MTCPEEYEHRIGKAEVSGSSPDVGNGGELIGSAKGGMAMFDEKEEIRKQLMIFVSESRPIAEMYCRHQKTCRIPWGMLHQLNVLRDLQLP